MKSSLLLLATFILCNNAFSQRDKKIIYPFDTLLSKMDSLVVRGSPRAVKSNCIDTIYKPKIEQIRQLVFKRKNVCVDKYGITPDGSISIFKGDKRVILLAIWDHTPKYYAVNIILNGQFTYGGAVISKEDFDNLFYKNPCPQRRRRGYTGSF